MDSGLAAARRPVMTAEGLSIGAKTRASSYMQSASRTTPGRSWTLPDRVVKSGRSQRGHRACRGACDQARGCSDSVGIAHKVHAGCEIGASAIAHPTSLVFTHILFGKPVATFPGHASVRRDLAL